jgi:hypothetical protein
MPTISAFYGILIQTFWKDHAHEGAAAEVIDGGLPTPSNGSYA